MKIDAHKKISIKEEEAKYYEELTLKCSLFTDPVFYNALWNALMKRKSAKRKKDLDGST